MYEVPTTEVAISVEHCTTPLKVAIAESTDTWPAVMLTWLAFTWTLALVSLVTPEVSKFAVCSPVVSVS